MIPWSSSTAAGWESGVVAGTGVVGAVVFGHPARHIAVLSHERFFVPVNSRRGAPNLAPSLAAVREALSFGDEIRAADVVDARLRELGIDPAELVWTDPLGPVAQLVWRVPGESTDDYRRKLDPDSLGVDISWSMGAGRAGLRVRAIHGETTLELELWSDIELTGQLTLEKVHENRPSADTVDTISYVASATAEIAATPLVLSAKIASAFHETARPIRGEVQLTSPYVQVVDEVGWRVVLRPAVPQVFRIHLSSDAPGPTITDTMTLPGLSRLALAGASIDDHVEPLWDAARSGAPGAEARVLEVAYAAGLRNIRASTGALPPTLQGVWQGTWSPAWSADYTMNGNVQLGTLASVLWTGTPELMRSLFRLIRQFPDDYRQNARAVYGVDGMLLPARLTTHGHANHFIRDYPHEFYIGHGSWLLRMAADYIMVTGDQSIVDEWLWEYTTEILQLALAMVHDAGGVLSPSYSPENTPAGRDNPLATNATAEIAALRDGLRVGAWLAEVKGETEIAERWRSARQSLPAYRIAVDGALAEWGSPWEDHVEHRHVSHLHGLWYESDEAYDDPELRRAAHRTVLRKIAWRAEAPSGPPGNMEMAFGLTSLGLAAATLGDAQSAYQCALWLARDHFTPALVSTHDAGAIFNLDASGALPAIVAAMLLSTSRDRARILPALPQQWAAGSVSNLTGRGALHIHELRWDSAGVDLDVELWAEGTWLRPSATLLIMPRSGRLTGSGVMQLTPTTLALPTAAGRVVFRFDYLPAGRASNSTA